MSSAVTRGRAESWMATSAALEEIACRCSKHAALCDKAKHCLMCIVLNCFSAIAGPAHSNSCSADLEPVVHAVLPLLAGFCKAERLAVAGWQAVQRIFKELPARMHGWSKQHATCNRWKAVTPG